MVKTGCDILTSEGFLRLKGKKTSLLSNPASVCHDLAHIIDRCLENDVSLVCLFGPQHGLKGDTQANMIEWEGYTHPKASVPVHSLYGKTRVPTPEMLAGLDTVLIDLPDIGARPYTYIWTAALMMKECARLGISVMVADRPNPLGGTIVEGQILEDEYRSFVGLFPLLLRHGMTIGEILSMINTTENLGCDLEIVKMEGWDRDMSWDDTGQPWVLPSPNMPTPDTSTVYPGMVFLEATNISEGRGTTRPFEILGAPWIDGKNLAGALSESGIDGAVFRPLEFTPAWDKYEKQLCGGVQIHVTDRKAFRPVRAAAVLIQTIARLYPDNFEWLDPPYEYDEIHMPIDILSGGPQLRETVDAASGIKNRHDEYIEMNEPSGLPGGLGTLFDRWSDDEERFIKTRSPFLLY
ncbi:MAG: DUF1343 domain-containing protein [Candidatus Krumholzibacteria bacterium]|nr:DUF1343 domain-containing protein [Candidatus Krumholzibacteria bacterium]